MYLGFHIFNLKVFHVRLLNVEVLCEIKKKANKAVIRFLKEHALLIYSKYLRSFIILKQHQKAYIVLQVLKAEREKLLI